jgi:Fe-S-cluster containining protein
MSQTTTPSHPRKPRRNPAHSPQIQAPETWVRYQKGHCQSCWSGCCTLPVEVSVNDLIRLELTSEEEAASSLKALAQRLLKAKVIQAFQPKSQLFVLAQVSGRDCLYLHPQTRKCTVYERRPQVCRSFPRIGPRPGYCPQQVIEPPASPSRR